MRLKSKSMLGILDHMNVQKKNKLALKSEEKLNIK